MPSLFFVAAASAREGRPVGAADLERIVAEDDLDALPVEEAVDRSERDRRRVRAGGKEAVLAVARGSSFFRQSHLASQARWSRQLTPYDGLIAFSPRDGVAAEIAAEVKRKLDPVTADRPISASRLAVFSRCGFQYLLQHVLRLEPGSRRVVVGPRRALAVRAARLDGINWLGEGQRDGLTVKVRSLARPVPARFDGESVHFRQSEYGVSPGQAAVLYEGERVLGGGWIEETVSAELEPA